MKTKNLILGVASFLVAIGGAFTALSAISPDYIHVRYAGEVLFICTVCPTCIGGPNICRVVVPVQPFPGDPIIPTLVNVYDNRINPTACTVLLGHNGLPKSCQKIKRIIAVAQ